MLLFRRMMALVLLTAFAVSRPASAQCEVMPAATAAVTAAAAHAHHADHSSTTPEPAPAEDGSASGSADGCALMTACAAAAPGIPSTVPSASESVEFTTAMEYSAVASTWLGFDPPPPRQNLI